MENFDLRDFIPGGCAVQGLSLDARMQGFREYIISMQAKQMVPYRRVLCSATEPVVTVRDDQGAERTLHMFGSNSYLGISRHPHVLRKVHETLERFGVGAGGPPLLGGTTCLHEALEQRLATLKGVEACLLFPSGFQAQLGWVAALVASQDEVFFDEGCHASFFDGIKLVGAKGIPCRHNDVEDMRRKVRRKPCPPGSSRWLVVEGVYSMDGDLAPLPDLVALAREEGLKLVVDDAHGTGVMGAKGAGTVEAFGLKGTDVFLHLGTFSKAFSVTGGFLCGSTEVVNYLRFMARPHMFTASLPATTVAAVDAVLDVLEQEPNRILNLHANTQYLTQRLCELGISCRSQSGIVPISLPSAHSSLALCGEFDRAGIFLNAVQYPAVPKGAERLRVSLMSTHTKEQQHYFLEVSMELLKAIRV